MKKIVLVTGATSGIGMACVKKVIEEGCKVIITGRNTKVLDELKVKYQDDILYSEACDMFNVEDIKRFVSNIKQQHLKIDVLINNAGGALGLEPFYDGDIDDWIKMINVNVTSVLVLTRLLINDMMSQENGIIINVGSIAGDAAYPNGMVYCAVKSAINTISEGMRIDLVKTNIRVSNIKPGLVETNFSKTRFKNDIERAKTVYEGIEALQAEDIANCIFFVMSQPSHVQIAEMLVLPTKQASGVVVHRE